MALLDWLKGMRKEEIYSDDNFLHIPGRKYFGWYTVSPDGRYTLTWRDSNDEGTHGGARASGMGRFYLLHGEDIIAEGHCERPNDGKVANNGSFILNDWLFTGELAGVFRAYTSEGNPILAQSFSANLYNNGLSADGRLAVCQTCNSRTADASVLAVLDLLAGRELTRFIPQSGWARSYDFPDEGNGVTLCYPNGGKFTYALDGTFVDRARWIEWSLRHGSLFVIDMLIDEAGSNPDPALAQRLIAATDVALADSAQQNNRAWALKLRGISLEATGQLDAALACYDDATALDEKAGVKRRAQALRKKRGSS